MFTSFKASRRSSTMASIAVLCAFHALALFRAQIRFHLQETIDRRLQTLFGDSGDEQSVQLRTNLCDFLQQRRRSRSEMQPPYAPVGRIGPPLHEAARLQPIDQTAYGDGFDFKK